MRKSIVFLLTVLCLAALVCAASAEVTIFGNEHVDMQIGLSTQRPVSGGFYSRGALFYVDDSSSADESSNVQWNVIPTNGGPALTILPDEGITSQAWLNLDPSVTYSIGGDYTYTLTADTGGTITAKTVTVTFVNNKLPAGYDLKVAPVSFTSSSATLGTAVSVTNQEMYNVTGETYAVSIEISGTSMSYWYNYAMWSDTEWEWVGGDSRLQALNIDGGKTAVYRARKTGKYPDHSYIVSFADDHGSNIGCYIPYTLYVTDVDGNVPALAPEVHGDYTWADWGDTVFDFVIYAGLGMESSAEVWNSSDMIRLNITNADLLSQEYGGSPVWTVTERFISGEKLDYEYNGDIYGCWGHLRSMPSAPSETELTVSCSWGGQASTVQVNVHVKDLSDLPNGLPAGISGIPDVIETQVGQNITLQPSAEPAGYSVPSCSGAYFCARGLWEFAERDWNKSVPTYTITKAGIFSDVIGIQYGGLMVTRQVVFRVKDENGDIPAAKLDGSGMEVTWYLGLPENVPAAGGVYSADSIGQLWLPESVRDFNDTNMAWNLTHISGPDNFELFYEQWDWEESYFFARVKPKSGALTVGTSQYKMSVTYKGETYEGDLTIHTVNESLPTGATLRVYETDSVGSTIGTEVPFVNGELTVKTGESYYLSGIFDNFSLGIEKQWINSWFDNGGDRKERWAGAATSTICYANTEYFTATNMGYYSVGTSITQEFSNLEVLIPITLIVTDANGNLPSAQLELKIDQPSQNIYLGLENYGGGLGYDSIGVYGEKGRASVYFEGWQALQDVYGNSPNWSVRRKDTGADAEIESWYEDHTRDRGFLEIELMDVPLQAGSVTYEITCTWGPKTDTVEWTANYIDLSTVPTGHDYPELFDATLSVGDTLTIEPNIEPAGADIPGYPWRLYVFQEQLEAFATLDSAASTGTKKVYTIDKAGVFSATILLTADTVQVGKETVFRISDGNGDVPKPEIQIGSWNGFERNIYIGSGMSGIQPGFARLFSDDFVDRLYFENEVVVTKELAGDPVWSIKENGNAPQHADLRGNGKETDIYLKSLPAGPGDVTYDITCTWDGKTWTGKYTVHFTDAVMPQYVGYTPKDHILVVKAGEQLDYDIYFRQWNQLENEGSWRDLSESLRDVVGWDEVPATPGVYEGYMETGCANLIWREELILVVTERDGTIRKSDYKPFGTVAKTPAGLTTIESQAFVGTKLTEIDVPAGVSIADDAFNNTGLVAIYAHDQGTVNYALDKGYVPVVD